MDQSIKVTGVCCLTLDEYTKYKELIPLHDWWWLATVVPVEKWRYISDEEYKRSVEFVNSIANIDHKRELDILDKYKHRHFPPEAYLVYDDGSIRSEAVSRGDISIRYAIRFEKHPNIKIGTTCLSYGENEYIVIDEQLAIAKRCMFDTCWLDSNMEDCLKCDYDKLNLTYNDSQLKIDCAQYYNQYGDKAFIIEKENE